jgi:hypothetical protein
LIDELLVGQDSMTVFNQDGLLGALKKAFLNRMMAAEFDQRLAQERAETPDGAGPNHRNGLTRKRVLTGESRVEVTIPRDREARFAPVLIDKCQRRLPGFDDKVISLDACGMSAREIQGHLEEIYGAGVSAEPDGDTRQIGRATRRGTPRPGHTAFPPRMRRHGSLSEPPPGQATGLLVKYLFEFHDPVSRVASWVAIFSCGGSRSICAALGFAFNRSLSRSSPRDNRGAAVVFRCRDILQGAACGAP